MADSYISREELLKTLKNYRDIGEMWNTKVCDPDTILRVLQVVENLVNCAPAVGPRQLGNELAKAKDAALKFHLKMLKAQRQYDDKQYTLAESTNSVLAMGFYKGQVTVEEQVIDWLERMVGNG